MTDLFLSDAETAELTGYKQAKRQITVLRQRGIAFFLNGRGKPKIARALIENGGRTAKSKPEPPAWQPAALRQPS